MKILLLFRFLVATFFFFVLHSHRYTEVRVSHGYLWHKTMFLGLVLMFCVFILFRFSSATTHVLE